MSNNSSVQDNSGSRVVLLFCIFLSVVSLISWMVIVVLSSNGDSEVANAEVTINLSKQTQNMKDCVLFEKDDKYYLSCNMKD